MKDFDKYLAKLDDKNRVVLERIRAVIKDLVPDAEEKMSYGIPSFYHKGVYMIGFRAFKDHLSLFPTGEPVEIFKSRLTGHRLTKGSIHFTHDNLIDMNLLKDIVSLRVDSIDAKLMNKKHR